MDNESGIKSKILISSNHEELVILRIEIGNINKAYVIYKTAMTLNIEEIKENIDTELESIINDYYSKGFRYVDGDTIKGDDWMCMVCNRNRCSSCGINKNSNSEKVEFELGD